MVDAIRGLGAGDIVRVRTEGKSLPNRCLRVLPDGEASAPLGEASLAEDVNNGGRYIIEAVYHHGIESAPWLRTADGYDSAGRIGSLAVEPAGDGG